MTDKNKKTTCGIIAVTVICCVIMAVVETLIEPPYWIKSALKAVIFFGVPLICAKIAKIKLFDKFSAANKKDIAKLLALGAAVYAVILGAYALTKNVFDYGALVRAQTADQKVDSGGFIWVALYISFGNSFLEEFLFRQVSFIRLSEYAGQKAAYIFSSAMFAVYHIAMIGGSFPPPLLILALIGLAVGGFIFDLVDKKRKNIGNSWIIHMFADLAIMTVWYINLGQ